MYAAPPHPQPQRPTPAPHLSARPERGRPPGWGSMGKFPSKHGETRARGGRRAGGLPAGGRRPLTHPSLSRALPLARRSRRSLQAEGEP